MSPFLLIPLLLSQSSSGVVENTKGVVVCDEPIAAKVGAQILRDGGNAVDAAVAVAFALAVVEPTAGNIGGGGFMLVRMADGRTKFIDYRETAPASAHRDMYSKNPKDSLEGLPASGVPGTVRGMETAQKLYGKLPWRRLVDPAVRIARDGFPLSGTQARALKGTAEELGQYPETKRVWLREGNLFEAGDVVKLPELAQTLARIRDKGPDDFYTGETSKLIVADMKAKGGHVTAKDLSGYKTVLREPIEGTYKGHTILTSPPPSSGGIALIEMLNILEPYNVEEFPSGSAKRHHLLIEAMKLAFADRAELLGDPDFVKIPATELLSRRYAIAQRARINLEKATPSKEIQGGSNLKDSEHTTHFSVVDAHGNVVSNTYTLNASFGCGDMIKGAGFLMNNEMDDFAANPGKPNLFGLIQGERNAIQPQKRPLSSMTPTIVLKNRKPFLVVGSPGGPTIINTVLHVITNVIDYSMSLEQAVSAPRFHHQWMPDQTSFEERHLSPASRSALEGMGHKVVTRSSIGIANCIWIATKRIGVPDRRYGDAAAAAQ